MKIVILGGNGLIGSKTVEILKAQGHEVIAASTKSGVNAVTGVGLKVAFTGADVVVDVMNSPSWADDDVMEFFRKSTENVLAAEKEAGVKHHVALSVVGTARLQDSGYFRAKQVQEDLIRKGCVPYTIVQATQFFEFLGGIADFSADSESKVRLSTGGLQPIAANDVSVVMAEIATDKPLNATIEIGGPERARLCDFVSKYMQAKNDRREIIASADAKYYGLKLGERSLVPEDDARRAPTKFEDWLYVAAK